MTPAALHALISNTRDDVIELPAGRFDFGALVNVRFNPGTVVRGSGRDLTTLACGFAGDYRPGCAFELHDGVVLENLRLEANGPVDKQSMLVGFARDDAPHQALATVRGCSLVGRGFVVYHWNGSLRTTINVDDCEIEGGRWLMCCGNSSGPDAAFVNVQRCTLRGRPDLSTYQGAVGRRLMGFCCRGGRLRAQNCLVELDGTAKSEGARVDEVRGAWTDDAAGGGSQWAVLESLDCHYRLTAGGAKTCFDLDQQLGEIRCCGGSGSGPRGAWWARGNVDIMTPLPRRTVGVSG
ncbi:MAG: hypothetical protein AB7O59_18370 [Pirellulales bacterium]